MNKIDALNALSEGKKITHVYFTPDEWMEKKGNKYHFEDGCLCYPERFWYNRKDTCWSNNWSIYKEQTK